MKVWWTSFADPSKRLLHLPWSSVVFWYAYFFRFFVSLSVESEQRANVPGFKWPAFYRLLHWSWHPAKAAEKLLPQQGPQDGHNCWSSRWVQCFNIDTDEPITQSPLRHKILAMRWLEFNRVFKYKKMMGLGQLDKKSDCITTRWS